MTLTARSAPAAESAVGLFVEDLRCEYLRNPLGIDDPAPRLSWKLTPQDHGARGQRQTAYQVLVASTRERLNQNRGDLWDLGHVATDQSIHVPCLGMPLQSRMVCWWKVRVWDERNAPSPRSEPALTRTAWRKGRARPENPSVCVCFEWKKTAVFAVGSVGYGLIAPPPDVDVVLIAPRMTGVMVRKLYEHGKGAIAQFAVHQDASGQARQMTLALCKGIGLTRAGVFESTFREEAELDLFAEQVVWAGLTAWIVECFEIGVEFGFSPELMVMELYASGEALEILGHMAQNGFFRRMRFHSTTSQYGTLSRGPGLIAEETKQKARAILRDGVKGGAFAREWSQEQAGGSRQLRALVDQALAHAMSVAEVDVIRQIREAHALDS